MMRNKLKRLVAIIMTAVFLLPSGTWYAGAEDEKAKVEVSFSGNAVSIEKSTLINDGTSNEKKYTLKVNDISKKIYEIKIDITDSNIITAIPVAKLHCHPLFSILRTAHTAVTGAFIISCNPIDTNISI